jgi:DNA polymerase-3 subunit beta
MKVSCLQENLAKGLSIVSRAVASRSTLPVLSNILVATDQSRLRLSATNLELAITCWIGAKIEEEGSTTVPAKTFTDIVNALPQGQMDMSLNVRTQSLNVRGGAFVNDVKCIDAQEFPIIPQADLSDGLNLNVADLREMIDQVVFAAATDDARPILTGVLVKVEGNTVTFAATDGFRLSVRTATLSARSPEPVTAIVPARALAELGRIAGDQEEAAAMTMPPGRGQVIFHLKDVELVSQLIEGTFPDYTHIVPKNYSTRTVMTTAAFLKACKAADIFARENAHTARFKVAPGGELQPGTVEITAQAAETGSNEAKLDATVDGPGVEIAFNVKYMIDVLNVLSTQNVALETNQSTSPGVVRPVGEDDFLYVVMPMRIGK